MSEAKPFCISKWEVWEAYQRVKANQGAAGVDEQALHAPSWSPFAPPQWEIFGPPLTVRPICKRTDGAAA
jgi:hypothetical protein